MANAKVWFLDEVRLIQINRGCDSFDEKQSLTVPIQSPAIVVASWAGIAVQQTFI